MWALLVFKKRNSGKQISYIHFSSFQQNEAFFKCNVEKNLFLGLGILEKQLLYFKFKSLYFLFFQFFNIVITSTHWIPRMGAGYVRCSLPTCSLLTIISVDLVEFNLRLLPLILAIAHWENVFQFNGNSIVVWRRYQD